MIRLWPGAGVGPVGALAGLDGPKSGPGARLSRAGGRPGERLQSIERHRVEQSSYQRPPLLFGPTFCPPKLEFQAGQVEWAATLVGIIQGDGQTDRE